MIYIMANTYKIVAPRTHLTLSSLSLLTIDNKTATFWIVWKLKITSTKNLSSKTSVVTTATLSVSYYILILSTSRTDCVRVTNPVRLTPWDVIGKPQFHVVVHRVMSHVISKYGHMPIFNWPSYQVRCIHDNMCFSKLPESSRTLFSTCAWVLITKSTLARN